MHVQLQHSVYSPIRSGQERRIHALVKELRRRRHRVSIVVAESGLERPEANDDPGIQFWVHPDFFLAGWRTLFDPLVYPRRLQRFLAPRLRQDPPDLVLAFNVFNVAATRRAAPGIPVGYLTGGAVRDWYAWLYGHHRGVKRAAAKLKALLARRVENEALGHAYAVFAEVSAVKDRLREENPGAKARYVLWPTPVDTTRFRPSSDARAAIRSDLGIHEQEVVVLCVGRLHWNKNFRVVVRALGDVPNRSFQLLIVGEGPEIGNLRALAAECGIADRVRFLGARQDVERIYAAADIFVHPALVEPYGNVVQEAAATGLACLVSPATHIGFSEYLADGLNALFADPKDERAWSRKLGELLEREPLRRELGSGALALIGNRPDWPELTEALLQIA